MLSVVHRNLWDACILRQQCDNREPNAKVGNRARMESLASVDFRTVGGFNLEFFVSDKFYGACRILTQAFQSISVLSSVNDTPGQALAHDHLADLDSFFYVLYWITIGYTGPNKPLPLLDTSRLCVLREWN